jgi:hypothetical protein
LPLTALPPVATHAQQSFQRFFPLLVDLPGWQGGKPDGVSMEIPGNSMVTAAREYQRGEAQLNAQVLVGAPAAGALAATGGAVKVETSDARMSTSTIDGVQVARTFAIKDKSGAVIVALGPNAVFLLSFNGINDDEGLALARRFNWKAMQAAVPK